MISIQRVEDVAISEFVLAELYCLLRNPPVLERPLSAPKAVEVIQAYRSHPRWRLISFPTDEDRGIHDALWKKAAVNSFAFRRLYDIRTAMTMILQGVTEFATANTKDFAGLVGQRHFRPHRGSSRWSERLVG
jgi:predicted nucleic acid-binding protein